MKQETGDLLRGLLVLFLTFVCGAGAGWSAKPPQTKVIIESPDEEDHQGFGALSTLPAGCEIWATGANGKQWKTAAQRIEMRTSDGPTDVSFLEEGSVQVTCYSLQNLKFGASGGVDNRIRLEIKNGGEQ